MNCARFRFAGHVLLTGIAIGVGAWVLSGPRSAPKPLPAATTVRRAPAGKTAQPVRPESPEIARMQETVDNAYQLDVAERARYFGGHRQLSQVTRHAFENASYSVAEKRLSAARKRFEYATAPEDQRRYFEEWSRARQYEFELLKVAARDAGLAPGAPAMADSVPEDIRLSAESDFEFYKLAYSRKLEPHFGGDKTEMTVFLVWLKVSKPELFSGENDTVDIIRRYRSTESVEKKRKLIGELHISNQRNDQALASVLEEYRRLNLLPTGSSGSSVPPPPPTPPKTSQ